MEIDIFGETMRALESRMRYSAHLEQELHDLTVEAESEDGLIRLTVGPPGHIRELELNPRVKRLDVETIAERITTLMNDASDLLRQELSGKVRSLMPDLAAEELIADFRQTKRPSGTR
jgi:DNA-binding protein YbaB